MASIVFDSNADFSRAIEESVQEFLQAATTLEVEKNSPVFVFQDGKSRAYYITCHIRGHVAARLSDTDARLVVESDEAYRANRELLFNHKTFKTMKEDALEGREFNDIIVEYSTAYNVSKPLKVWGGQHRTHAIIGASSEVSRFHGFRVYFGLSAAQRMEVALISNTSISVSDDTFDRMVEETMFGDVLRRWCRNADLLPSDRDFPDVGSRAEVVTVKLARSFIINFYKGQDEAGPLASDHLDEKYYDTYIAESGSGVDPEYKNIVSNTDILKDSSLLEAGKRFAELHRIQRKCVENSTKIQNRKGYRNKAFVHSVLCGWSFVAGLLQSHPERLRNHYKVPKTSSKVPDPLNAKVMSEFRHDTDAPTYRGLGTRSGQKDRQRIAQLFLARSLSGGVMDKELMIAAVSKVVGLQNLKKGY